MSIHAPESTFSFDFDYNEFGPEELAALEAGGKAGVPSSIFDFAYDMPLDSEGDLIYPDEVLDDATIKKCISTVGPVINTFKHAFTKFEARNKRLSDIDMLFQYIHLRNVDLADNRIHDLVALLPLTYLQVLNVEGNKVTDMAYLPKFLYLQALNLANNDISYTAGFQPNKLTYLSLAKNHIRSLDDMTGENFPNLLVLELRENKLSSVNGLELPKLENLYIVGNQLMNLQGLENCPKLKIIHARHNQISDLSNFPNFEQLEYLNLRNNKLTQVAQVIEIGNANTLNTLVLSDNPVSKEKNYRLETITACSPSLARLDKYLLSEIEQVEAIRLRIKREKNIQDINNPIEAYLKDHPDDALLEQTEE